MKKDRGFITKILIILFCCLQSAAFADDVVLPDFNYYSYYKNIKIFESRDEINCQIIRNNQNFDNFFDSLMITIYRRSQDKQQTPLSAGRDYIAKTLAGDNTSEKYILKDEKNNYLAVFCSSTLKRCEIVRFLNGYDGLIRLKYTHNNIWHFQNNIGSFVEMVNRIQIYPNESLFKEVSGNNTYIRL